MGAVLRVGFEGREHADDDEERIQERSYEMVVTELSVAQLNSALSQLKREIDSLKKTAETIKKTVEEMKKNG